jgi:hypothetical protein
MHKFLKAVGGILFIGPVVVTLLMALPQVNSQGFSVYFLAVAFPVLVSGAIVIGFASIIEHLEAIRAASEQQAKTLQALIDRRIAQNRV